MAKIALLIGISDYAQGLNSLPSAVRDIEAMRRVLQHSEQGGFDQVGVLANPEPMTMQEAIETLFSNRSKEDLVLLFFSGHGVKDDSGRLYFATSLTRKNSAGTLVRATAVPASFVQDVMSYSRCKRQVIILDCCFSGAFAEGMTAKDDDIVDVQTQLGGEGRAVLTSSTSTQYSFEQQGSSLSIYTRFLVEGIETGAADMDGDGWISIDELHDYARKKVQAAAPAMKPKIYAVEEGFTIRLAKAPVRNPELTYRKEVERFLKRGEMSTIGRSALTHLQARLGLTAKEATTIEEDVLKPHREYQERLNQYEQVLTQEIRKRNPLTPETRDELKAFQEALGLRTDDVKPIVARVAPRELGEFVPDARQPTSSFRVWAIAILIALSSGAIGSYWVFSQLSSSSTTSVSSPDSIEPSVSSSPTPSILPSASPSVEFTPDVPSVTPSPSFTVQPSVQPVQPSIQSPQSEAPRSPQPSPSPSSPPESEPDSADPRVNSEFLLLPNENQSFSARIDADTIQRYVLPAEAGEVITVQLTEGAATFDIHFPLSGFSLGTVGLRYWEGVLPESGSYQIDVVANQSTSFTLSIDIRDTP
jgi:uncharacterized caspase-like protein